MKVRVGFAASPKISDWNKMPDIAKEYRQNASKNTRTTKIKIYLLKKDPFGK